MSSRISWIGAVALAGGLAACMVGPEGEDDGAAIDPGNGAAKVFGVREWSDEACAILNLASTAAPETLDDDVRLNSMAVRNIITFRKGPDATLGTTDDVRFSSLAELASIPHVKVTAFRRFRAYVAQHLELACTFPPVELQIVSVSDWHGQLDPLSIPNVGNVGGAAVMSTYFAQERAANPNTLVLTAGDAFGATPPLASFFEERPAVLASNLMGFDADGVGNHNFDRGVAHFEQMARMTEHPYLSANLENLDENMSCPGKPGDRCIEPYRIFEKGGVKIAVIGVTNGDAPNLVKAGNLGTIEVSDPAAAAMEARADAEAHGATVFVLLPHVGASGLTPDQGPVGPIVELAHAVSGFDLILADHTNVQFQAEINGQLVVENKSSGATYARSVLSFDRSQRRVVARRAEFVVPMSDAMVQDPAIVAMLQPFRTDLAVLFDGVIATSSGIYERGNNVERLREVPLGDLVADAMRMRYETQIGYTNGGGLRSALPSSYAPQNTTLRRPAAGYQAGPPYDVVVGDVYSVLPFGNIVATRTITGQQLWAMMEHAVEALPTANGWFGQISGFKVTFDSSHPIGSRVVSITLDDGTAVANDTSTTYTMATSDFIDAGGDGYAMLAGSTSSVSRDKMADVLLDHIRALGTLSPATQGRLVDLATP